MYWVVLACALLVESWTDWLLVWIPFYQLFRLVFLLYLVLPQTQGARVLYQTRLHPWLAEHEARIDEFIGSAHARLRSAGIHYLKQAITYLRTALGLPAQESAVAAPTASTNPQTYTKALFARFTLPSARWPGGAVGSAAASMGAGEGATGPDFYSLLAGAVGALGTATGAAGGAAAGALSRGISAAAASASSTGPTAATAAAAQMTASGTLVPPHVRAADRASFLATQRDRLRTLLSALEREAAQLEQEEADEEVAETMSKSSSSPLSRPLSGVGGLSKSRSEADFEKIDAESGAEEDKPLRRRQGGGGGSGAGRSGGSGADRPAGGRSASGSWLPWGWGGSGDGDSSPAAPGEDAGKSSSIEK